MPHVAHAGPHLAAPVASALSSVPVRPVTIADLAALRGCLEQATGALDDLLVVAADATSETPLWTRQAQRADITRAGTEVLGGLRTALAEVDALSNLLRLAAEQRQRRSAGRPA